MAVEGHYEDGDVEVILDEVMETWSKGKGSSRSRGVRKPGDSQSGAAGDESQEVPDKLKKLKVAKTSESGVQDISPFQKLWSASMPQSHVEGPAPPAIVFPFA